jgi:hypothetical protein
MSLFLTFCNQKTDEENKTSFNKKISLADVDSTYVKKIDEMREEPLDTRVKEFKELFDIAHQVTNYIQNINLDTLQNYQNINRILQLLTVSKT